MSPKPTDIDAIVFDYGNTLIEFAAAQIAHCDNALGDVLLTTFGECDEERLAEIRYDDRRKPYFNGYVERDLPSVCSEMVEALYQRRPTETELEALVETRVKAFIDCVTAPDYLHEVLEHLKGRYRLALLSNYPCGRSIRSSLDRLDLTRHFESIVVSGEVGRVKPHPAVFEKMLGELAVAPERALYVGDNWLADVQGAKAAGMWSAHIRQFDTPEVFDEKPGDHQPDLILHHLRDLVERF